MGKIVTFPREKHASGEQMRFTDMKSEEDRAILARILLETSPGGSTIATGT